jgi:hypothetical protein
MKTMTPLIGVNALKHRRKRARVWMPALCSTGKWRTQQRQGAPAAIGSRLVIAGVVLLLAACGGGGGGGSGQAPQVPATASQVVGAAGGSIAVTDRASALNGISVAIPAGALSSDTTISIEKTGPALAGVAAERQFVVKLGPDGTQFAAPVTVKLPLAALPAGASLAVVVSSQDGAALEYRKDALIDRGAGTASVNVTHFSTVAIATLATPAPGEYTYVINDGTAASGTLSPFTAAEITAVDEAMQSGALAAYYKCAGYAFKRLPALDVAKAHIFITRDTLGRQTDVELGPMRPVSGFATSTSQARISVNTVIDPIPTSNPPILQPLVLYTGAPPATPGTFDLRTIIAHELSHWMGIEAQRDSSYDRNGLFSVYYDGSTRIMGADDKRLFVERFPNCALPVITILADPTTVAPNATITLSWAVRNHVDGCTASGDWTGAKAASGSSSVSVGPAIGARSYTLSCTGASGTATASASVQVSASSVGTGSCERVSSGSSTLIVRNQLPSGLEVFLPQFAFGADMFSGECNSIGLEFSQASLTVDVELTQCTNSFADSTCTATFGQTKRRSIVLNRGGSQTIVVDPSAF